MVSNILVHPELHTLVTNYHVTIMYDNNSSYSDVMS